MNSAFKLSFLLVAAFCVATVWAAACVVPIRTVSGAYEAPFGELTNVTKFVAWTNGVAPLAGWQAWKGTNAIGKIGCGHSNSTSRAGNLYAYASASSGQTLGTITTKTEGVTFGVVFQNLSPRPIGSFGISFDAVQWGFSNEEDKTIVCSWRVSDAPIDLVDAQAAWMRERSLDFRAECGLDMSARSELVVSKRGDLADVVVRPGSCLAIRFADPPQVRSAGTGIANFRLTWCDATTGLVILAR